MLVWVFSHAVCNKCSFTALWHRESAPKTLAASGTRHLNLHYPVCGQNNNYTAANMDNEKRKQTRISQTASGQVTFTLPDTDFSMDNMRSKINEFIVLTHQSFSVVETASFKAMFDSLPKEYNQKGRRTVRNDIVKIMFPSYKEFIVNMLKEEKNSGTLFCLGSDLWTCGSQHFW